MHALSNMTIKTHVNSKHIWKVMGSQDFYLVKRKETTPSSHIMQTLTLAQTKIKSPNAYYCPQT